MSEPTMKAMGKCARAMREEANITLTDFAKLAEINQGLVSQFENGIKMSDRTLGNFLTAMGISLAEFKEKAMEYEDAPKSVVVKPAHRTAAAARVKELADENGVDSVKIGKAIGRDWMYVEDILCGYGEFADEELRTIAPLFDVDFTYLKAGGVKNAQMEAIKRTEQAARKAAEAKREEEEVGNTLAAVNFLLQNLKHIPGSRDELVNAHRVLSAIRTEAEIKVLFK